VGVSLAVLKVIGIALYNRADLIVVVARTVDITKIFASMIFLIRSNSGV